MEKGLTKLTPELMTILHNNGGSGLMPFKQEIFVLDCHIAGTGYCENITEKIKDLNIGDTLTLRRQPNNEYDEYAIAVYNKANRIGWIPMSDNLIIARLMDGGKLFSCKIAKIKENKDPKWPSIKMKIFMID